MNKTFTYLKKAAPILIALSLLFASCPDPATGESGTQPSAASVSLIDPPDAATPLPETISLTLTYDLAQMYQKTLTAQSADALAVSFDVEPLLLTNETAPYQFYFALMDESGGVMMQLAASPDFSYGD